MIVTVTPSPAIDWTARVEHFALGAVNRIVASSREPSGKGLNVSWALHHAQVPTTAVFPGGAGAGTFMTEALTAEGLPHVRVPTDLEVRTNLTLVTENESTKVNEPGTPLTDEQATALVDAALTVVSSQGARAVLLCGSHPAGFTPGHVSRLVEGSRSRGATCVIDSSGPDLAGAIDLAPDLIKPNVRELAELSGNDLDSVGDVVTAARQVCAHGTGAVLASLGADGAVYVDTERAIYAQSRNIPFANSVGAGDALLAGFMAHDGDAATRLAEAVLWASSAVACPTTLFPVRSEFADRITVAEWAGTETPLLEKGLALSH